MSLLDVMQRVGRLFETGPLKVFHPAFDAIDSFLHNVATRTDRAPHVRGPNNTKRYMSAVIIAVMPCIAAAVYFFGWRVLAMIVVTYVVGLSIELLFAILRGGEEINEGFFVTGLLYPLILPPNLPMWMVGVGIAFGVVVGKELFGGTGRNPFNPALVARCFLLIGYPLAMSSGWAEPLADFPAGLAHWSVDATTAATPLAAAKQGAFASHWDLLWGTASGSAGATSSVLIILAGAFLMVTKVANWRTIAGALGSFAVLLTILGLADPARWTAAGWSVLDTVTWHLLAGGLLFGIVYMATDPVSSPITDMGKWFYGIIIGVSTLLIRYLTGYVEGVMFAILLGNIAAPVLDEIATRVHLRRLSHEG